MFRELNFEEFDRVAGGNPEYGAQGYNSNEGSGGYAQGLADSLSFSGNVYINPQVLSDYKSGVISDQEFQYYASGGLNSGTTQGSSHAFDDGVDPVNLTQFDINQFPSNNGFTLYDHYISPEARDFANGIILNLGSTDSQYVGRVYDDVAQFYDYATAHGGDSIQLAGGGSVSYADALQTISHSGIIIGDNIGITNGAITRPSPDSSFAFINIDPASYNQQSYQNSFGNSGIDYVVFHEIGHDLNLNYDFSNFSSEPAANTVGLNIESDIGLPPMTRSGINGSVVTPGNGYYPMY